MSERNQTVRRLSSGDRDEERTLEFWSEGRMRDAQPVEVPFDRIPRRQLTRARTFGPNGAYPVIEHPILPKQGAEVRPAGPESYVTRRVTNTNHFPPAAVGKLYVRFGDTLRTGTAWVVGRSGIVTSAHLLYDRALGWGDNVLFRARSDNGTDAGRWAADTTVVRRAWVEGGDLLDDFGAFTTYTPIQPSTGSLGYMANYPINQGSWLEYGYPSREVSGHAFDGQRMWETNGAYMYDAAWLVVAGGNMTHGADGGPWVLLRDGGWYVNGMTTVFTKDPSVVSPYFGNEFLSVVDELKRQGGS
jgi:hypothetical protein